MERGLDPNLLVAIETCSSAYFWILGYSSLSSWHCQPTKLISRIWGQIMPELTTQLPLTKLMTILNQVLQVDAAQDDNNLTFVWLILGLLLSSALPAWVMECIFFQLYISAEFGQWQGFYNRRPIYLSSCLVYATQGSSSFSSLKQHSKPLSITIFFGFCNSIDTLEGKNTFPNIFYRTKYIV